VEKVNGLILAGIKPRLVEPLKRSAGCWVKELPSVLWSLRTTPNRSVGFTPFFLVYRAEAVLPTDIEFDAPRVVQYMENQAKEAREDGVDLPRGGTRAGFGQISALSAAAAMIPQLEDPSTRVPQRRSRTPAGPKH
jgi:hypothetical protein